MGNSVKDFAEVQVNAICSPSLVHCWHHPIREGHGVGQAGLAFGEAMLPIPSHLLSSPCLSRASRRDLPRHSGRLTGESSQGPPFHPF